jgi:uncharacterized alkaline shock family protein YloU
MEAPDSSPAVRAHVAHPVIATYVADAMAQVTGVRLTATRPVRVTGEGPVDLELHVALAAGVAAPNACRAAAAAVRRYLQSMMAIETGRITVVVEEAAGVAD